MKEQERLDELRRIEAEIEKTEASIALFEEVMSAADLEDAEFLSERLIDIEDQAACWGLEMMDAIPPAEVTP